MAKIKFEGVDDFRARVEVMGRHTEGICKYALYEGVGVITDAIKANTPVDTGDLKESVTVDEMTATDGEVYTTVHFSGYDEKGVPNPIKARVINNGNSHVPAKPFVRHAVNSVKGAANAAMGAAFDRKINEYMNE